MTDWSKAKHIDFSGYKIEWAAQDMVDEFAPEMDRLLLLIGKWVDPKDPEGWAADCWVSDKSMLSDFSPDESVVARLAVDLGFPVEPNMLLYEICARMRGSRDGQ